jgi:putative flippase GtrA
MVMFLTLRRHPQRQRIAAAIGGILATAADVSVLAMCCRAQVAIGVAAVCGVAAGGLLGFFWNKRVSFCNREPIARTQVVRFVSVVAVTACLMALCMQLLSAWFGLPYLIAKLISSSLVFLTWTFPAQRRLVFGAS